MKERYSKLTKEILLGLMLVGAVAVASTSPRFLPGLFKQLYRKRKYLKKEFNNYKADQAFKRLRKNRLVIVKEKDGVFTVELTQKGKRKVQEIQFDNMCIEKPLTWDKKWRLVIFDIPNKHTAARNALRRKMRDLDFYPLQKSVWVHPYPCKKEIQFLIELFNIGSYVNIVTADTIYNDVKLRKRFNLL